MRLLRTLALVVVCAATAHAETRVVRLTSKILGEERVLHVNLPLNYSLARQRYPVTYLLDGQVRQFFDVTVAAAGYDIVGDPHDFPMPAQIIVAVDHRDRGNDLGRNQEVFTRFLVEEVVPFIDREFRTTGYRTLIGHSLGGRFGLMTLCRAPGVFPSVIAISAAGGDSTAFDAMAECLTSAFKASGTTLRQVVLSAGELEPRLMAGVQRLQGFLRANAPPTWRWTFVDGPGLGHTETPMATIPPGLRFVYDKSVWEMPPALADSVGKSLVNPEKTVAAFYTALSTRVGTTVVPSLKWMLNIARTRLLHGDAAEADDAARKLITVYPEDLEAYGVIADLAVQRGDTASARRSMTDALRMLGRLEMYDVYQREQKKKFIEGLLNRLSR